MEKDNKDVKLCKVMIMDLTDDKKIFQVEGIEYGYVKSNGKVKMLTGDYAGESLPQFNDKFVDGESCVEIHDIEDAQKFVASNDLDEIKTYLEDNLFKRKYVLDDTSNRLEPLNDFGSFEAEVLVDTEEELENKNLQVLNLKNKKKSRPLNVRKIDYEIRKNVIGQDEAIRKIVAAVFANQRIFNSDLTKEQKIQLKKNILIIGKTGVGKTETIMQLAKHLDLPYTIEDATRYTKAGYEGESVEDMLTNLIKRANGDIKKAEKGILVVDEIDKKRSNGSKGDVGTEDVQFSLLKIVEGGTFNLRDAWDCGGKMFDTSMLTVIFCGAFTEMHEDEKIESKALGFNAKNEIKNNQKDFIPEDFVKFGMVPELMGRVSTIIQMNDLTLEDYKQIIKKSKLSPIILKRMFLKSQKVNLRVEDTFITNVAEEAMKLKMGARGIKIVLDKLLGDIDFDVLQGDLQQIKLSKDKVIRVRKKDKEND